MSLGITRQPPPAPVSSPPATRASPPGWRDPRLWVGIAIVAASVLLGAVLLGGSSDDTVPVWAATDSMGAGHVLTSSDLTVRRVHFADGSAADLYVPADGGLPADLTLTRSVSAGELLPQAAVGSARGNGFRRVPVSVSPDQVPGDVHPGTLVDVYLRPSAHGTCPESAVCQGRPVVSGVTVLDAPVVHDELGSEGRRMLVLGMTRAEARTFFHLLVTADDPELTIVGRG